MDNIKEEKEKKPASYLQDLDDLESQYESSVKRQMEAKKFKDFKLNEQNSQIQSKFSQDKLNTIFIGIGTLLLVNGITYPALLRLGKKRLFLKGFWAPNFFAICPTFILNGAILGVFQGLLMEKMVRDQLSE